MEIFHRYKLTDERGCFIEGAALCLSEYPDELKCAIKEEWREQINKVIKAGIKISHFDSHQHTHVISELQDVLIDLMREFGVIKVRRKRFASILKMLRDRKYKRPVFDKTKAIVPPKRSKLFKLWNHFFLIPWDLYKWEKRIKSVASITDDLMTYQNFVQDISYQKKRLRNKTIELECHPGSLPNAEETNLLMGNELRKYVSFELINYWQL